MQSLTHTSPFTDHVTQLKLAREIAADLHDLGDILQRYAITEDEFQRLQRSPQFLRLLEGEILAWQSAGNTVERTRLKAASMLEEWLLEANRLLHDPNQVLSSKTELAKLLARIGRLEQGAVGVEGGGERFSVTINLGADHTLKIEKELPTKTITLEPGGGGEGA